MKSQPRAGRYTVDVDADLRPSRRIAQFQDKSIVFDWPGRSSRTLGKRQAVPVSAKLGDAG